jgi:hypothetical protein
MLLSLAVPPTSRKVLLMRFFPTSLALVAFASVAVAAGCSDSPPSENDDSTENGGSGGNAGGAGPSGGVSNGGVSNGGVSNGGVSNGGVSNGGVSNGGVSNGGVSNGGVSNGGVSNGGTPTGGASVGGSPPAGGNAGSGNTSGSSTGGASTGGSAGSGPDVDQMGKMNARPGSMTSTVQDYLRLGEIRILNNNWGSAELGCNTPMSVFVNQDRSFGWNFNRGDCDTANSGQHPDFPQIEFGIHPFGIGNSLATSPDFSSTTLLPLQIRNITSASVNIQGLNIQLQRGGSWNITFEFWLSTQNPNTQGNAGVHTELMTFWGWQSGRWPSAPGADGSQDGGSGTGQMVNAGKAYTLWVQRDNWASGWRYFQFRDNSGPQMSFNGTVNVKTLLDYLVNTRGFSPDLWVTRLEVGSEIDDLTQGTVTMQNITFEVNGQSRSPVFGQ